METACDARGPAAGLRRLDGCVRMPFPPSPRASSTRTNIGMRVIISPKTMRPRSSSRIRRCSGPNKDDIAAAPGRIGQTRRRGRGGHQGGRRNKNAQQRQRKRRNRSRLRGEARAAEGARRRRESLMPTSWSRMQERPDQGQSRRVKAEGSHQGAEAATSSMPPRPPRAEARCSSANKGCSQGRREQEGRCCQRGDDAKLALEPVVGYISASTQKALRAQQPAQAAQDGGRRGVRYRESEVPVTSAQSRQAARPPPTHNLHGTWRRTIRACAGAWSAWTRGDKRKDALDSRNPSRRRRVASGRRPAALVDHHLDEAAERRDQLPTESSQVLSN